MKQKILKFAAVFLMTLISSVVANAQKSMDVTKFTRLDNDLMARVTKPVKDNDEGKLCALIRVVTPLTDLEVRSDALGIVQKEKHAGELWLYVPYGARSLSFSHDGYYPLLYQYELPIEEATVYELRLSSFNTSTDAMAQNSNTQLFVLTHNPDEAKVYIDEIEMPSENGVFASMMSKGDHTYKVTAKQYEDAEGSFTLENQPVRETANLSPLFGTFQLRSQPVDGFDVSVNGEKVGKTPYKSERLKPGSYRIQIEKKDYVKIDTLIRLREGDDLNLTLTSEEQYVYDHLLGGRNFSIGIQAGYIQPFATSSSGGSFTGSPINYSLGDSRENVSYTAQSGFTAGIMADIRLYKNFYLMVGANYTLAKYTNKFAQKIQDDIVSSDGYEALVGDRNNSFEEKYAIGALEIPVLASYRFVFSKISSLHLNLGPYLSYGIHSKMKFSGSTDIKGNSYLLNHLGQIDYDSSTGTFWQAHHFEGDFNMYSTTFNFTRTVENEKGLGTTTTLEYTFKDSPYKKLNYGIKLGATYEVRGFQIGVNWRSSILPWMTTL